MKILPELQEIRKLALSGNYDIAPVSTELLSDFITPIEALRKLKAVSTHCYMLESALPDDRWGRYSFLGFQPKLELTAVGGQLSVNGNSIDETNPSRYIRNLLSSYKAPRLSGLPTFTGGLVGYFSFDYLCYSEPSVKCPALDEEGFKDVDLMLFDKVIVFDNFAQKLILIANMPLKPVAALEENYNAAINELKNMANILKSDSVSRSNEKGKLLGDFKPLFSKSEYCDMVNKAKQYIKEGDIFQIVLSNRLVAPFEGSLLNTYRLLRAINPSPYMFYLGGTDVEVAGASPETLVKSIGGRVYTFPLAGTRKRGKTEEEDAALERELLADEKELSEHNMLVDLGRNDIGKISKFGSVRVDKLHSIEKFSHVMHIGSTVSGELSDSCDSLSAIEAVLPAGTLSGAPKIRACQLIGELERNKRGIYGGAIGYIDFSGNMDTAIAIRIAYKKNGKVFVRSGAGIVADSVPENEFTECINKAQAVVSALEAQEVTDL